MAQLAAGAAAARDAGSVRRYAGSAPRVHVARAAQPAAARRPRGGGSPSKRQLLDAVLSLSPDAHPGTGGRLVTIETVDLHGADVRRGTDEPLPRACRGARSASRPGGPAVALGHRDAEYGSRPLNGPPSKRRDLVRRGRRRACVPKGEVFYEASCRTKKSNCSRLGVIA